MRNLILIAMAVLGTSFAQAQITYSPEKGGMKLYEFENRFTISDSAQPTATFMFADGTDIKYDFRNHSKYKFNKIRHNWNNQGYVIVRVGGKSLNLNRGMWRIYKYTK